MIQTKEEISRFAWQADEPGVLERTLQKVSGLHRLLVPFLVQNIGWFVSGFFFISGSVFLITYTAGFAKSLIISVSLFVYTLLILTGAYQLLRKRPELRTPGTILMTSGMLLIPLSMAASVRLPVIPQSSTLEIIISILMVMMNIGVFYYAVQLASGITDRALQGLHSRLFIALTAIQAAVPLISKISVWQLTAFFHLIIIGLLAFGLIMFINDWLKSVFTERRKTAIYAAGTLVYAALVSFVHLRQAGAALPDGYSAPFVMILSGLLFYTDSKVKEYIHQYPFLSRFSFAVYGISVLSFALCFNAPSARLMTLMFGTIVYGTVLRNYLTLPPLYLLLGCLSSLYGLLILKHVPAQLWFMASLPGLSGLFAMQQWALKRNAMKPAILIFRAIALLTTGLIVQSLYHSAPGISAVISGFLLSGLIYAMIKYAPMLLSEKWFYAIPLSVSTTCVYLPILPNIIRAAQYALVLTLWASIQTWLGFRKDKNRWSGILPDSALLNVFAAVALIAFHKFPAFPAIPVLAISSGIFFWQSLFLRKQRLFYAALVFAGASGALFKITYFPGHSVGIAEMLTALGLWIMLRQTDKISDDISAPVIEIVKQPLQQAMLILWAFAMFRSGWFLYDSPPTPLWVLSAGLGTMMTMLLIVRFRLPGFLPLPMLMGLFTILGLMYQIRGLNFSAFCFVSVLYALTVRIFSEKILKTDDENFQIITQRVFQTTYLITIAGVLIAGVLWLDKPDLSVIPTLLTAIVFLFLSDKPYDVIAVTMLTAIVIHVRVCDIDPFLLHHDSRTGLLITVSAFCMFCAGYVSDRLKNLYTIPLLKAATILAYAGLAALILLPVKSLLQTVSVLGLLTVIFAGLGVQRKQPLLLNIAQILGLILLHTWLMIFVPSKQVAGLKIWEIGRLIAAKSDQIQILLPWYSLQLMIAAWIIMGLRRFIADRAPHFSFCTLHFARCIYIAIGEWLLHAFIFVHKLNPMPLPDAKIHGIAALSAAALMILMAVFRFIRSRNPAWVYRIAVMAGAAGLYLRLLCFGAMPPTLWDTAALLAAAYILFILERLIASPQLSVPLLRLSVAFPLFTILTVPWQLASPHAACALLLIGTLYLSVYHCSEESLFLYLAMLTINISVYLWIPVWAKQYDLIQLYIIPASLSILMLVHLHRKELKRSVLNGTRLAAVSALYISASADVFLRPELSVFILMLALSLLGMIMGIALRIRAFLYGGVLFAVINVTGQLLRFCPENQLGKGMMLMVLGAVIMAAMIWFNIQREAILKRIRIFRADLEEWA